MPGMIVRSNRVELRFLIIGCGALAGTLLDGCDSGSTGPEATQQCKWLARYAKKRTRRDAWSA
jgi:hypothetical protein